MVSRPQSFIDSIRATPKTNEAVLPYVGMVLGSFALAAMGAIAHRLRGSCDWQVIVLARVCLQLEGLRQILQRTTELAPAVADLPLHRAWAGLRPATPDELPYVGLVPSLKNLWVSAGHFRKGILLAPICARLLAQSLGDGTLVSELSPFNPGRQTAPAPVT